MATAVFPREPLKESEPHLETTPIRVKGILAATDLSPQATRALKIAARLAKRLHARLHLLYTIAPQLYLAETGALTPELQRLECSFDRYSA